jgi:hypothetical protein
MAPLGVPDRVRQHVADRLGAVVAKEKHPGVERARHGGGERTRAGDQVESEVGVVLDRRAGRRRTLAAQERRRTARGGEQDRDLTSRTALMGLDDVQHESGRHGGVERVATVLEHRHRAGGGQPMRRRHHSERALERRSGREHAAILSGSIVADT